MSTKLAKLEEMIANLERKAGLNPDVEVIYQRDDASWPDPVTNAPLVVERLNFRLHPELRELQRKNARLTDQVRQEREHLERVKNSPAGRRAWRSDDTSVDA